MRNIYFLINSLSSRSGAERVACQLANEFMKKGYQIIFYNRNTERQDVSFPLNEGVEVISFNNSLLKMGLALNKLNKDDILIIHNMGRLSIFSLLFNLKCKVVCLEHGPFFAKPPFIQWLTKKLYTRVNQIVTITHKDALNYKKFCAESAVEAIYNSSPFKSSFVNYNENSKRIIAVGRLAEEKNFNALIEAWSNIASKYQDWVLEIYGDGALKNDLNNLIYKNNIKNIKIFPNTPNILDVYKNSSFLVLTSKFEGLGMVLIEAQSFGLPLVAFDCPYGPSEIINNNENGFLVKNGEILELSSMMEKMIISPELRRIMSYNAFSSSKRFSTNEILSKWDKVLNKL
ncbi:glycosyltransferase family 4 protein [Acinetobacter sp. WU_MDCI_Abxc22]|uniref:glycosyltransferase family 4 protein n=1 Tax=Acinetobacter sp. WU_MDCI_Abxc22 TaxID=2850071 RepID=UPI0021CD89F1|nr:glycosyltransferase family 4 protein [Acinetobacter sp. WU_MDCI_Abxc22]MCU4362170.1 glycosyltransferase family 4 protein [Acinetobacter sp. WU_MDCI_Abxc22]